MRSPAALVTVAALIAAPVGASAQSWVTVDATAVSTADGELTTVRAEYAAALNAGDALRLRALYAPDAIAVLGDGALLRGAEEIGRYFLNTFEARATDATVSLAPQHFSVEDGIASETGSFSESRQGDAGAATGVYVTIYTRGAEGQWRIAMELRTRGRDRQIVRW